jgi:hypothetical protein
LEKKEQEFRSKKESFEKWKRDTETALSEQEANQRNLGSELEKAKNSIESDNKDLEYRLEKNRLWEKSLRTQEEDLRKREEDLAEKADRIKSIVG